MTFTLTQPTHDKAIASGEFTFNRIDVGIGQGEWSNTDEIKARQSNSSSV